MGIQNATRIQNHVKMHLEMLSARCSVARTVVFNLGPKSLKKQRPHATMNMSIGFSESRCELPKTTTEDIQALRQSSPPKCT